MNIIVYTPNHQTQIIQYLKYCQNRYSHIPIQIDVCDSLTQIKNNTYDIAYIDGTCEMKIHDTIQSHNPLCLIFILGHCQKSLQAAFYIKAFQYIPYHISFHLFQEEFRYALSRYKNRPMKFLLRTSLGNVLFRCQEIIYIETYYKNIKIVTMSNTYFADIKQKESLFSLLNHSCFLKTHRSYLVNMNFIKSIQPKYVELINGEKLPSSSLRSQEIIIKYNQFYQLDNHY